MVLHAIDSKRRDGVWRRNRQLRSPFVFFAGLALLGSFGCETTARHEIIDAGSDDAGATSKGRKAAGPKRDAGTTPSECWKTRDDDRDTVVVLDFSKCDPDASLRAWGNDGQDCDDHNAALQGIMYLDKDHDGFGAGVVMCVARNAPD